MFEAFYRRALRPILFQMDPEAAYRLALAFLAGVPPLPAPSGCPELVQELWGVRFANPVGVAAGLDKDARAINAWQALGYGFAELGTITPRPQPGNSAPRMWRLPEHRALVNRLGFPSQGAAAVRERLERIRSRGVTIRLGLNFGPNKDTPAQRVPADCAELMDRLGPFADLVVINLSSPNTPGLRDWQAPERMREVFAAVLEKSRELAGASRPRAVLVKIAPDLEAAELAAICETAAGLRLDGIVATNTTLARDEVGVRSDLAGGLSGQPLKLRARNFIRTIRERTGGTIPIIGVGGVASAEDAYGHIRAGASLVEIYTGMVYEGPTLAASVKRGLAALLRRDGLRSVSEAVGAG